VYSVFKQLGNGEFLHVASRDELEQAVQLVEALNTHWPGEYVVRDSEGNDVDLTK
jgi:LPS sulfotransferase NodH